MPDPLLTHPDPCPLTHLRTLIDVAFERLRVVLPRKALLQGVDGLLAVEHTRVQLHHAGAQRVHLWGGGETDMAV